MANRRTITLACAAVAAVLSSPAMAKDAAPAAHRTPAAKPTAKQRADFIRGIEIFRSFSAAVASKKVKPAVKTRLIECLYNNKLHTLSLATGKFLANHPQLSQGKPVEVWRAAARVCGITFHKPVSGKDSASPPAKKG